MEAASGVMGGVAELLGGEGGRVGSKGCAKNKDEWRFCVAPMMGWTDEHCLYALRLLSRRARLYTQMKPARALTSGSWLEEAPSAGVGLQLGGSDAEALYEATLTGVRLGYEEVNLNAGCPGLRAYSGRFGAYLMKDLDLAVRCMEAISSGCAGSGVVPSVKYRLGVDDDEEEEAVFRFTDLAWRSGMEVCVIHARKAVLGGLKSPRWNREVPKLDHELALRVSREYAGKVKVVVNGGLCGVGDVGERIKAGASGGMLGRGVMGDPWKLTGADELWGDVEGEKERGEVLEEGVRYADEAMCRGVALERVTRRYAGLARGLPGARRFRRALTEEARGGDAGLMMRAWREVERETARAMLV